MTSDRGMDKLLRSALATHAATPADECPQPADLAAFLEGRLADDEHARLEQHFSSCETCQETLAAIARMPPAATDQPAPVRGARLTPARLRWLVPVGAAAVILIAYVATNKAPKQVVPQSSQLQLATRLEPAMRPAPTVSAKSTPPASTPVTPPPEKAAPPTAAAKAALVRPEAEGRPARDAAPTEPRKAPHAGIGAVADRLDVVPREEARADKSDVMRLKAETSAKSVAATLTAPARPAAPVQAQAPPPAAAQITTEQRSRVAGSFAISAPPAASPAEVLVAAPAGRSMWRFDRASGIWHSPDAGASWQQQIAMTSSPLVAGSAPDAVTCWAAGRDGLVMLTTDGAHWEARTTPVRADLTAIQAQDGRTATVTASDGRRFTTTDGGATWTAIQ